MLNMNIKQNFVTFLFLISFSGLTNAASFTGNAKVSLLDSIEFIEQKVVDFGAITLANGTCSMGATGTLEGSNGSSCSGEGQVGELLIHGTADQTISIYVEAGDSAPGIDFTPQLHSDASTVLVGGQTVAKIGGSLAINSASAGDFNLTYVVVVNYN
jgi:hypothetical protein